MKIQDLAIIFIIIILPISLVIATYTQYQIQTINTQTLYDSKLTSATYDAIRAFQINTTTSATSELTNSKTRDLEASISTFRNSIKSTFSLAGYSEDALDRYIPALVYTLYDGFYIYSPYNNMANQDGTINNNGEGKYGLKPYISYSCRYKKGSNIDVVITYALDNHISVQGIINNEYVNKDGYLIDNINYNETTGNVKYNGVEIENENVKQYLPLSSGNDKTYEYIKLNGTTYYLDRDNNRIIARLNDTTLTVQCSLEKNGAMEYNEWVKIIEENSLARDYYIDAYKFTDWFKNESGLQELTYADAIDTVIDEDGNINDNQHLWANNTNKIFVFTTSNASFDNNIENELSSFNKHRLEVIKHKIEINLAIAIANYNSYSGVATNNVFQMPALNEEEWYNLTHNISVISFLQGLPIGGKLYNGYSLVTNSESKEVVLENNIYILGRDTFGDKYYKIGDRGLTGNLTTGTNAGKATITSGVYSGDATYKSAGRLNLDFERGMLVNTDNTKTYYYYPIKENNASYNSVVMQNDADTYDDIYKYVNDQSEELKTAFYTALGRERASKYKKWSDYIQTNLVNVEYTITYLDIYGRIIDEKTEKIKAGGTITVPDASEIPLRPGEVFKGWKDGSTIYTPGSQILNVNNDITLIPYIEQTYTITYHANGGFWKNYEWDSTNREWIEERETEYIQNDLVGETLLYNDYPQRDDGDYEFMGWATSARIASKGYVEYNKDARYSGGSIELYAVWRYVEPITYNVSLMVENKIVKVYTVNPGDNLTIDYTISKGGYVFKGWTDGNDVYNKDNKIKNIQRNIVLEPVFEIDKSQTYTITYHGNLYGYWEVNMGSMGTRKIYDLPVSGLKGNTNITGTSSSSMPMQAELGYVLKGWATTESRASSGIIDYQVNQQYTGQVSIELWAVWRRY